MAHFSVESVRHNNTRMKSGQYLCFLALFLTLLVGCGNGDPGMAGVANDQPPALDQRQVAQGKEIYALHCASCHGANLEGEVDWKLQNADGSFRSPPHDETGHTWHHSDAKLINAIRLGGARLPADIGGTSAMPAYDAILTDQEIVAVLDFIKSTWPDEQLLYQWERTLQEQP